ncbi:hypothetical protein, partial [Pedobacter sp. ASV28]|uniref:hypothetical protein n=1 Tax=Pedobacter sp. ASV28 TaxID=2795123 RepID=UPI001E30D362
AYPEPLRPTGRWSVPATNCHWSPILDRTVWRRMFSDTSYRKTARRSWYRSDRTARRAMLRSLTRDALFGGEVDEDVIDNRVAGLHAVYSGGWWD